MAVDGVDKIAPRSACGTDVTARGFTYEQPCTVVLGQPVCSPLHVTAWRGAVEREVSTGVGYLNQFKGLVQGAVRAWTSETQQAAADLEGAQRTLANVHEWTNLPANSVEQLKEAAARARCASEVLEAAVREEPGDTGESSSGSVGAVVGGIAALAGIGLIAAVAAAQKGRRR